MCYRDPNKLSSGMERAPLAALSWENIFGPVAMREREGGGLMVSTVLLPSGS